MIDPVSLKMNHSLEILIIIAFVTVVHVLGCDVPVQHYRTMKCTPVGGGGSSCPTRFECPSITYHDNSKCYFNGKTYNIGQYMPEEAMKQVCAAGCQCKRSFSSEFPLAQFYCAQLECPEEFSPFDWDNCIRQYAPDQCCSSGEVCGQRKQKLAKCTLKGETFFAGQYMQPSKCITCICHQGFRENNIATDRYCSEQTCSFELFSVRALYSGAVPVYYGDECCPREWRMPKSTDRIATQSGRANKNTKLQCRYGKLTMNVGDTLVEDVTDYFTYRCSCLIPPLAQCVMTNGPIHEREK